MAGQPGTDRGVRPTSESEGGGAAAVANLAMPEGWAAEMLGRGAAADAEAEAEEMEAGGEGEGDMAAPAYEAPIGVMPRCMRDARPMLKVRRRVMRWASSSRLFLASVSAGLCYEVS